MRAGDILRLIDSAARYQHVGSGVDTGPAGIRSHAAVHLQLAGGVAFVNEFTDGGHLGHLIRHEFLTAEARLHGHHQNQLHLIDIGQNGLPGGLGLQDDAGLFALGVNFVDGGLNVFREVRFHMDRHQIGACVAEFLHIPHRLCDHQMDVQKHIRDLSDGFQYRDANGDVGDKHAVHHVHMDIIGIGDAVNIPPRFAKSAERIDGEILIMGTTSFLLFSGGRIEPRRQAP